MTGLTCPPDDAVVVCAWKHKRKRYATTDEPLRHWVQNYRNGYLRVLVTREGPMGENAACQCGEPVKYRCGECHGAQLYWRECIVEAHRLCPLCRIEANRHFFNTRGKITDNAGSQAFQRRYKLALHVVRQWRNLRALKRGGIGNDRDRLTSETREGELAVECLACPKASVNLPVGWEHAPPERRFLFAVFLAVDACFRLKRKKISSWASDPSIQDGWSYFVLSAAYAEFMETLGEQKEMSTCTGLAALDHANTKTGEKYGNMEYIVASAWWHLRMLLFFLLSYDIMCQWSKNLWDRLLMLLPALRFQLAAFFVKYVIPKLHILRHLRKCQENYSLLYTVGAAQADVEGIEHIWSSSGLMGASTQEMGPGLRQDTLDDFWHFWNWNKVVGMGTTLHKCFLRATKELSTQKSWLENLGKAQQQEIAAWKKSVDDFECAAGDEDGEPPTNPYEMPPSGATLCDIELELVREEQELERTSATARDAAQEMMTEYLMLALGIKGQQCQLSADLLANRSPTMKDLTNFVTCRTRIACQIKKLQALQHKYSPGALQRAATAMDADAIEAKRTPLFLPSALSLSERQPPLSVPGLTPAEERLQDAQCHESLDDLQHALTVKGQLQTYCGLNSRHQHQNTRSRGLVDNQQDKVDVGTRTYQDACGALIALSPGGASAWCMLEKADLRLLEDEEEAKRRKQRVMKGKRQQAAQLNADGEVRRVPGMGEKSRLVSWIWLDAGSLGRVIGEEIRTCVKVEWCKAYARVKRWQEEVLLLQEEMVRCLLTLQWQAKLWDARADASYYCGKITCRSSHLQGAMAFAARQAAARCKLEMGFHCLCGFGWDDEDEDDPEDDEAGPMPEADGEAAVQGAADRSNGQHGRQEPEEEDADDEPDLGNTAAGEEDVMVRTAQINELLAVQTILFAYNEL
ncbi:CxC2 domain-containing protein [Mycena sanguinolenta]|uniref:CxC2 domain-containing protein n=1 Tax=Mycena sanguinolenta TaxID=230812 RepID=A0A8H7DLL8_9AGAR|nr:CxC2 domain-containing protein [Mycena sanguinolenta]